jgi:hypothetical protein
VTYEARRIIWPLNRDRFVQIYLISCSGSNALRHSRLSKPTRSADKKMRAFLPRTKRLPNTGDADGILWRRLTDKSIEINNLPPMIPFNFMHANSAGIGLGNDWPWGPSLGKTQPRSLDAWEKGPEKPESFGKHKPNMIVFINGPAGVGTNHNLYLLSSHKCCFKYCSQGSRTRIKRALGLLFIFFHVR